MKKERIFLTDIVLHTRGHRQTGSYAKASDKGFGRMYSPLPKDYNKPESLHGNGKFRFEINLPQDLKDKLERGEAELVMPEGGLNVYAGTDVLELMDKMEQKKRNQSIHRGGTWHGNKE